MGGYERSVNPALKDALDAIMENFNVIAKTKTGLEEGGRVWFSETLKKELRRF